MKKCFAFVLCFLLCIGLFAGCGPKSDGGEMVINCLARGDRLEGEKLESDPIIEYVEQKFGVQFKFTFEPSPTQTEVYNKLNMLMADGSVPDMMIMRTDSSLPFTCMEDLVEAGYLVNMQEYVKGRESEFPNIAAQVGKDDIDVFKASDGQLYLLPRSYVYDHVYIYRQDWLDEIGMSMPTNETEFKNVLQAFKNNDPDKQGTTGLALASGFWFEHIFAAFVGAHRFYEQGGTLRSVWDANGERAPQMIRALQYVTDLYQNGLIFQDVFTSVADRDELTLFESGRAGCLLTGLNNLPRVYKNLKENFPDAELSYGVWSGPAGLARVKERIPYYEATAVNSKSGKSDKIMEILEWLMSEEGEKLTTQGLEGVHYTMNADGTKTLHLDAEGSEYLVSPYKHPLRNWVRSTAVFDEFVYTQDWAESFYPYYENYCLNSTAVFDMTDGYFSRIPKRVSAQIGNNPEITLQKWEGYFMTGKDGNNAAVTVDAKSFAVCWADLVVNKMDVLAEEYSKLVLQ